MKSSLVLFAWKSCKSVAQLVHLLSSVSQSEYPILYNKLRDFICNDAKSNAMLLLVAQRFNLDVGGLVSKIPLENLNVNDAHILYRALSECNCGVDVALHLFEYIRTASLSSLAILNYTSGYVNFIQGGHIVPDEHSLMLLLSSIKEHLHLLKADELLDLACSLVVLHEHSREEVVPLLERIIHGLREMHINDLVKLVYFIYDLVKTTELDAKPLVCMLHGHLNCDANKIQLNAEQIRKLLYILAKHYDIRPKNTMLDAIAIDIRRVLDQFTLEDVSNLVVWLSKLNYSNVSTTRLLANVAKLHLKDNLMGIKATILANLFTGFSRLGYKSLDLYKIMGDVLQLDAVLQELQIHDLVNIVRAHARIHWVNVSLFKEFQHILLASKLTSSNVATQVLIAHGKLGYENVKLNNFLTDAIDFEAIKRVPLQAEKLKLALHRLGIFCPELGNVANVELPRIAFKSTGAPMRRLPHVRRFKWVW